MSSALGLVGWWFLPNVRCQSLPPSRAKLLTVVSAQLITGWAQSIWYSLTIRAGDPKPTPGTPRFNTHRRRILVLVISLYLAYTIVETDYDLRLKGNYYTQLGVGPAATEREIKSRFRRLAAVHHPDKSAPGEDDGSTFMALKTAADTLTGEAQRFAYERFGPGVVEWKQLTTRYDYVFHGAVKVILPHYISFSVIQYVMGLFGYLDFARYWRWLILVALCVFEVHLTTRPESRSVSLLNALFGLFGHPPFLPFQVISLARRLCLTLYVAFSQLGPLLFPPAAQIVAADAGERAVLQVLESAKGVVADLDGALVRSLETELSPFKGDDEAAALVQRKIKEFLVQNTIRADPMVKDAMGNSIRKRRVDAPAGARGNR
jgi:hypothetical protein